MSKLRFTCSGTGPTDEGGFHYAPRIPGEVWDRYYDLVELAEARPLDAEDARNEREVLRQEHQRLIERHPDLVPAYERIGAMLELDGDVEEALAWHREAAAVAEAAMPDRYEGMIHWGDTNNRPYLRARGGIARTLFALGRFEEAAREMRWHLRANSYDAMGFRFLLPHVLLHAGQEASLQERSLQETPMQEGKSSAARAEELFGEALKRFGAELSREDQVPDPASLYGRSYALLRLGRYVEAVRSLRLAFLENIYIAELVLEREPVAEYAFDRGGGGTSRNRLAYAYDYLDQHGDLWQQEPVTVLFVVLALEAPVVKADLRMYFEYKTMLTDRSGSSQAGTVMTEQEAIERRLILSYMDEIVAGIERASSRQIAEDILAELPLLS